MKDHLLYPFFCKFRPKESQFEDQRALQPFVEFFTVLYLSPLALLALVWLFAVSDFTQIALDLGGFIILFVSLLIIGSRTASIPLKLSDNSTSQITISLGSILLWSGLFIWGPVVLVIDLLVNLILRLQAAWQRSRYQPNVGWMFMSYFMQDLTNTTLASLIGITIYTAIGGKIPLEGLIIIDWIPAFVAIIISAFFPAFVMLPVIFQINRLINVPNIWISMGSFIMTVVRLLLIATPFAIPFTLLYTQASPAVNIFATIGLVLVNLLVYYLSRTNQHSRQRTREMTQLEALGQKIIQAPADGSTLREILEKQIAGMFQDPQDILEIRIFEGTNFPGFAGDPESLNLVHPPHQTASPDSYWDDLLISEEPHLIIKDVIPAGTKAVYGDAIIDKITSAAPNENGTESICIGGVLFTAPQIGGPIGRCTPCNTSPGFPNCVCSLPGTSAV